jgi:hypothetical protein
MKCISQGAQAVIRGREFCREMDGISFYRWGPSFKKQMTNNK